VNRDERAGQRGRIPALLECYLDDIDKHRKDISWLAKTESLQESPENYQTNVKTRKCKCGRALQKG
jgi:hypothetical protein